MAIAHFYEIYRAFIKNITLELSNECLKENLTKTMKLMLPFTPHLALECLEKLDYKDFFKWPDIDKNLKESIKFAVQVNGKTRDIITVNKNLNEKQINEIVFDKTKAKKFIHNKEIKKTIFL